MLNRKISVLCLLDAPKLFDRAQAGARTGLASKKDRDACAAVRPTLGVAQAPPFSDAKIKIVEKPCP
jgi:hypothetical protein